MPEALGRCPDGRSGLPERQLQVAGESHLSGDRLLRSQCHLPKGRLGKALQVCPSAVVVAMGANSAALRSVFAQETFGEILSHWDDLGTSPAKCFHKAAEL